MAPIEMIQTGLPLFLAQPTAPPSSPNLPSFERIVTLSSDNQFIDMVKAVVVMQIASPENLEQLILKLNKAELPNLLESPKPVGSEAKEDGEYIFVVRHQVDNQTKDTIVHFDIKSERLRGLLQTVLKDVCGIVLEEEKLFIEQNSLRTILRQLEVCHNLSDVYSVENVDTKLAEPVIDLDLLPGFEFSSETEPEVADNIVEQHRL